MQKKSRPVLGYILKGYPRISETFISNEILLLEKLGFTLRLFPMRHPRESFSHPSVKEISARIDYLPTELQLDFCRLWSTNCFLAAKHPKRFLRALRYIRQGENPSNSLATLKHLLQGGYLCNHFLLDGSVDHLHGHFAHSPTSVTLFASILSGLPFSFTAHAKDIYTSKPAKLRRKIDRAQFVVTCTGHNKEYLEKLAPNNSIERIYHGIDLSLFNGNHTNAPLRPPYKILTVARMTAKKGLPTIYKGLALLKERGLPFHHTLIGEGDDRPEIEDLISSLNLESHCSLMGTRTHDEVLRQFRMSNLFVLGCEIAKNGDRDGIPNVLVESLAMGVPAIATTVSAIPEILLNRQTGITVAPKSPKEIFYAMEEMLTDHNLRNHVIKHGQTYVRENFDNSLWIHRLAKLFQHQYDEVSCDL